MGNGPVAARMGTVPIRIRRPQWSLLLVSLVIAASVVGIGYALSVAVTGDDAMRLPDEVEKVEPVPGGGAGLPAQTSVFVDLLPGYEGVLVIDGLELPTVSLDELQDTTKPGKQVELPPTTIYERGNATLTFDPVEGSLIPTFTQGEHIVQVIYWKITEGRAKARSYTWSFNVF